MNAIAKLASRNADRIAAIAVRCLHLEVDTHPKPGLVSHIDSGAHRDMDAALLHRSADALKPYFATLAAAGAGAPRMQPLRNIGLAAEAAMLAATNGVNTHRGAIFGLGLLAAAAGLRDHAGCDQPLGRVVADLWGDAILAGPAGNTHGAAASRRYGAGGARAEAALGFPSVYRIALPVLRDAQAHGNDPEAARIKACFALIAAIDDTNLLHRGGLAGLGYAKSQAATFLAEGGIDRPGWKTRAHAIHAAFIARNLSPGGAADLLAMTLFVDALGPDAA